MYNFDQKLDQRGFDVKWDAPRYPVAQDKPLIPMWVADTSGTGEKKKKGGTKNE